MIHTLSTNYSSKEQAIAAAEKYAKTATRRGFPTKAIEPKETQHTVEIADAEVGRYDMARSGYKAQVEDV